MNCSRRNPKPKTQCKVCLSYWDIGIVYCTCGHFLRKRRGENQKFIKYTMDFLSIPEYVIKKGRPHGHRYGKRPGDREYFSANQLKKKCKKKFFQGIHDRFIRDETFRNRMIECKKRKIALADETQFDAFTLCVKLSTVHRKEKRERKEKSMKKHQESQGLRTHPSIHVKRGRQCSYAGTVAGELIKWSILSGIEVQEENWPNSKTCFHGGKGRSPTLSRRLMTT